MLGFLLSGVLFESIASLSCVGASRGRFSTIRLLKINNTEIFAGDEKKKDGGKYRTGVFEKSILTKFASHHLVPLRTRKIPPTKKYTVTHFFVKKLKKQVSTIYILKTNDCSIDEVSCITTCNKGYFELSPIVFEDK